MKRNNSFWGINYSNKKDETIGFVYLEKGIDNLQNLFKTIVEGAEEFTERFGSISNSENLQIVLPARMRNLLLNLLQAIEDIDTSTKPKEITFLGQKLYFSEHKKDEHKILFYKEHKVGVY